MGCVQCLEEHDLWCGDAQESRHLQFNLSNVDQEKLPIMTENDEENTEMLQTQKGHNNNSTYYRKLSQKNYQNSNINSQRSRGGIQNHHHKVKSDDSLFHSIPQSQRCMSQIDYYHLSRKIFDSLNDVRIQPEAYQSLFNGLDETCDSRYRSIKDIIDECTHNSINNKQIQLIQQYLAQNKKGSVILWNETVHSTILTHLPNFMQKGDVTSIQSTTDELNKQINFKLKGKYSCTVFDLNAPNSSDLCFWNLIYNNTDKLKELFLDRYHSGAICCMHTQNDNLVKAVVVLINKITNSSIICDNENEKVKDKTNDILANNIQQNDVILFNNQVINDLLEEDQLQAGDFLSESNSMLFQFANEEIKK